MRGQADKEGYYAEAITPGWRRGRLYTLPELGGPVQKEQMGVRLQRWQTAWRFLQAEGGSWTGELQEVESRWWGISM